MDAVIPWPRLLKLISPYYHQGKTGRVPHDLERMLRIYFMQQWFNLSDPQAEDAIYDSESMRRFARVELGEDRVPDESTILRFRHLLEKHGLTESMFEAVKDLLAEHRNGSPRHRAQPGGAPRCRSRHQTVAESASW